MPTQQDNSSRDEDFLRKCTVAILNPANNEVLGTGVIVTDDGLIVTCYHVVDDIAKIKQTTKSLIISSPKIKGSRIGAHVDEQHYDEILDIAFLQLEGKLPEQTTPAILSETINYRGNYQSFGFRESEDIEGGLFSNGIIQGRTYENSNNHLQEVIQLTIGYNRNQVPYGMSGAPVLDIQRDRVIGIISRSLRSETQDFAIPVESLIKVYPEIKERNPGLQEIGKLAEKTGGSVYKRRYHAFLSQAHTDERIADNLYRWLRNAVPRGEDRIYYDKPEPGVQGSMDLGEMIPNCRSIIILLSRDSISKGWVKKEHDAAMGQKAISDDFKIIPVRIEKCDTPRFIDDSTVIELHEGRLDLDTSKAILERMYYRRRIGPEPEQASDLFISRGWKEEEKPFAEYVCRLLAKEGFRLIGDAEDQENYDTNRIKSIISSCGGFVAIVPYRAYEKKLTTSEYIIDEIEIAQRIQLPSLIVADPDVYFRKKKLAQRAIKLRMEEATEGHGKATLEREIRRIREEWKEPQNRHYVFFATDLDRGDSNEKRIEVIRDHIQLIRSMNCKMAPDYKYKLREMVTETIPRAYLVIADIPDKNFYTLVEAGIALGAGKHLRLVARQPTDGKKDYLDILNHVPIEEYANDNELLQKVHRIAYQFRRRILNYELR